MDANVLIEAKNRYYAFDIAPGFWEWLDHAHDHALACSIDAVKQELLHGDDELSEWAIARPHFFRPLDQATAAQFRDLSTWASSGRFTQAALNGFTSNTADYLLVAHARAHSHTLVTHERPQLNARRRVLIPDACIAMGVRFADTFSMLRETRARLDLHVSSA